MTGFTAITTERELDFPDATDYIEKDRGIEFTKPPKTAVSPDESNQFYGFVPYENLVAVLPMEEEDDQG